MSFLGLIGLILWPILTGLLFLLIVGGPLFLAFLAFEGIMLYFVNPIIATIRDIPFIGPFLCFVIVTVIGLPLLVFYAIYIAIPMICIVVHGVTYGAV
jgi:hypothetical protein